MEFVVIIFIIIATIGAYFWGREVGAEEEQKRVLEILDEEYEKYEADEDGITVDNKPLVYKPTSLIWMLEMKIKD